MPTDRAARAGGAAVVLALLLALVAGCRQENAPGQADGGPPTPAATVEALATQLQAGDLAGYARAAIPPALHAELETAWREGRSRWPLSELPMAGKVGPLLAAFAAEGAEQDLMAAFDRQFAGAERELDAAAESLTLFGVQYVKDEGEFSDAERVHYAQVIQALGDWAEAAPLADRARAKASINRLSAAARAAGLDEPADFNALGMQGSLERVQPFMAATLRTLADYGLDLRQSLDGMQATDVSEEGDRAVVEVRYPLAGRTITTRVHLERIDGKWYPSDSIRNARASLAPAAPGDEAAEAGTPAGDDATRADQAR
ncbi:MAG TPA: hypothetical protein VFM73_08125 [Xanthomonadaceae bacterium]|nr:hypothetical protein [Xanthomonadaceae bacterium]